MKITPNTNKALSIFYGVGIFALSIYLLFFYLQQKSVLIPKDAIYYLAIADGILTHGAVVDLSTIPVTPILTPQNGVVVFHLILSVFGLEHEGRLMGITIINYLLHLSAVWPLYKIARRIHLSTLQIAALLGLYVGSYYFYYYQLMALNDGAFNALSVWLVYLVIASYKAVKDSLLRRTTLVSIFFLTIVLVHFRIQAFTILAAAFLAAIIVRRYSFAFWMVVSMLAGIASLALIYIFIDTSGILGYAENRRAIFELYNKGFFSNLTLKVYSVFNQALSEVLFTDLGPLCNLIYCFFILGILLVINSSRRQQNFAVLFISLLCFVGIAAMILFFLPVSRYLVYLFPFFYLLIMFSKWTRPIGYVFISIILILSFAKLRFGLNVPESENNKFWRYLHEQHIALSAENTLLISEEPRRPYLFLKTRSFVGELTWEKIKVHQSILLVGSRSFIQTSIERIEYLSRKEKHNSIKSRSLTPGYSDPEGFQLLELYNFTTKAF